MTWIRESSLSAIYSAQRQFFTLDIAYLDFRLSFVAVKMEANPQVLRNTRRGSDVSKLIVDSDLDVSNDNTASSSR